MTVSMSMPSRDLTDSWAALEFGFGFEVDGLPVPGQIEFEES